MESSSVVLRGSNKAYLPAAQFTMTKDEKDLFLKVLKEVRVPDGYSSNISRRVRSHDRSIGGLKSHDSHILMQQLIPLAIRRSLPKNIIMGRKKKPDHPRRMMSDVLHNRTSVTPPSEEASRRPLSEGPLVTPQQLPCTQPPRLPSVRPPSVPPQQLSSSAYEPSADPSTSSQPTSGHVSSSSTSTRRGRGCAKGIKEWGTGKKLDIQFDGNYCPIGDDMAKLTTQLGIIVRNGNIVPLTFLDWNNVPDDIIDAIWKDVKDEFNRQLSMLPEDGRTLEARNAIFHELIGHDGHGYCRTYGRIVPRRAVYKDGAGPSQSTPQPSTIDQITQKVPDASSGHRAFRESAEDENPYTPPPEDQV
ncbi:hypothetical protein HYC85_027840 [Camellia sinensis]|uniref:Uncharacterized protein n=1 Tax=Camellia sinensis TaxID=4442 RepID=A0A7J7FTR1_CAMSI|nr:hypothetical protein HYC85_027840 [Camellia sinensis]